MKNKEIIKLISLKSLKNLKNKQIPNMIINIEKNFNGKKKLKIKHKVINKNNPQSDEQIDKFSLDLK